MQTENDERFGGPVRSHVGCFSSPPAPFWHSFELLCVCFDASGCFPGAFSREAMGMFKGLRPTSGGGNAKKRSWGEVGGGNSNQMRSPSHSPGIKTAFYVILLTFLSAQRRFLWNSLSSDAFSSAWSSRGEGSNVISALMNRGRRERRRRNILGVVEECWGRPSAVLPLFRSRTRRWDLNPNRTVLRSRPVWEKLFFWSPLSTCMVVCVAVGRYGCCSHRNLLKDTSQLLFLQRSHVFGLLREVVGCFQITSSSLSSQW